MLNVSNTCGCLLPSPWMIPPPMPHELHHASPASVKLTSEKPRFVRAAGTWRARSTTLSSPRLSTGWESEKHLAKPCRVSRAKQLALGR
ncbi:hypothetical protein VUR80DRAFT_6940 [Thermomyces stellatus]